MEQLSRGDELYRSSRLLALTALLRYFPGGRGAGSGGVQLLQKIIKVIV